MDNSHSLTSGVPIPSSLRTVACLFIIFGLWALIDAVMALFFGKVEIDFTVLCIFIGKGLLQLNPNSRKWALFFVWLGLIISPLAAVLFLFNPGQIKFFGHVL